MIKFERALVFVDELEDEVAAFFDRSPYIVEHVEQGNGDLSYVVRVRAQPPVNWPLLIGDAIHNARSGLDHLAWALVERAGGNPGDHTFFPIADKREGYGAKLRTALKGANQKDRDLVRSLEPWQGGDDDLWRLHRLDIVDKHRLVIPVGSAHSGVGLGALFARLVGDHSENPLSRIFLNPADHQCPLQDGAEVFRVSSQARSDESLQTLEQTFKFEIAFGDGTPLEAEPVAPTLRRLVEHAAAVSRHFKTSV